MLVKKHLEALRDGFQLLNLYDAELTDDAVRAVRDAASVRDYQVAQLRAAAALEGDASVATERIEAQLNTDRPWREIVTLAPDLAAVRTAYRGARTRLLERQEQLVEQARGRVKAREGFSTLTADQAHRVLRALNDAPTDTTAEAIAPPLESL